MIYSVLKKQTNYPILYQKSRLFEGQTGGKYSAKPTERYTHIVGLHKKNICSPLDTIINYGKFADNIRYIRDIGYL